MSIEEEIFIKIDGYDRYYISNFGRVKALPIKTKFGNTYKKYPERFVKSWQNKKGYHYVTLSEYGIKSNHILHRLVALAFVENPKNYPQVNHLSADKNNNRFDNLEWCSAEQNLKHARDLGLNNSIGSNNKLAKFSKEQIILIRKSALSTTDIANFFRCSIAIISRIRNYKSYKDVE